MTVHQQILQVSEARVLDTGRDSLCILSAENTNCESIMANGGATETEPEVKHARRILRRKAQKLLLVESFFNTLADRMWI